jgi:hypothetical protein
VNTAAHVHVATSLHKHGQLSHCYTSAGTEPINLETFANLKVRSSVSAITSKFGELLKPDCSFVYQVLPPGSQDDDLHMKDRNTYLYARKHIRIESVPK